MRVIAVATFLGRYKIDISASKRIYNLSNRVPRSFIDHSWKKIVYIYTTHRRCRQPQKEDKEML